MKQLLAFLLPLAIVLSACRPGPEGNGQRGRILLWHALDPQSTAALESVLNRFQEINPETDILTVAVDRQSLAQQYFQTASLGLGPDLLIAPANLAGRFARSDLIQVLSEEELDRSVFNPASVQSLLVGDSLVGVPWIVRPVALYVNPRQSAMVPETLDELLAQAEAGFSVGMDLHVDRIGWGIGASGGGLFSADGMFLVTDSGLSGWLSWLKQAQETPGVILTRDERELLELFVSGRLTYLVAGPELLPTITEQIVPDDLMVATLPAGPGGPAEPFIRTEALFINSASSRTQSELALAVARFLSNEEQSTTMMREAQFVPANRRIRVHRQVYPLLAGFVDQSRQAVADPPAVTYAQLDELGYPAIANVLSGLLTPEEAVCQLAQVAVEDERFMIDEGSVEADCE